jgi:hypothetical protein
VAMSDDEWVDIPEWDAAPQTPPQLTGAWLDGVAVPRTPPELLLAPPEQLALLAPWTPPGPPPQTPPEATRKGVPLAMGRCMTFDTSIAC